MKEQRFEKQFSRKEKETPLSKEIRAENRVV